jgi:DNA polymerase-3 subunit alpha
MQIAQVLANYTLGGADILRKAMGKKATEEMAKQRATFLKGATSRGIDAKIAENIFDLMEKFAGYGFNKSHSAAYALVAYQTAWLKAHYPAYFMAAVLTAEMQNTDKIVTLIDECHEMGLTIVPPDVNTGEFNFIVNDKGEIVYGLGAIKGLGEGPVESILKARADGPFNELLDLCLRINTQSVNKRTMEALIRSGALDGLVHGDIDYSRAMLTATLAEVMQAAEQRSRNSASGVDDLFGDIAPSERVSGSLKSSHVRLHSWAEQQRLIAEKQTLGLYLSGHPIREYLPELSRITTGRLANLRPERGSQLVAGLLHDFRTMRSKKGERIAFLILDDSSGRFEISLFAKEYEKYRDLIQKDAILLIECTVSVDDYSGGIKGRAKQLMTLAEVRKRFANRLALNLNAAALEANFCEHLANILKPYRRVKTNIEQVTVTAFENKSKTGCGNEVAMDEPEGCQVVINYERSDFRGCIMLGQDWLVSPTDDLIQRLRMEYGKEKVVLDYERGTIIN